MYKKKHEGYIDWIVSSAGTADKDINAIYPNHSLDEFQSDAEVRAGYKYHTGNEPKAYLLTPYKPAHPHLHPSGGKVGNHLARRYKHSVQENPALGKFWRKVDET